jgi:hypothetical protein
MRVALFSALLLTSAYSASGKPARSELRQQLRCRFLSGAIAYIKRGAHASPFFGNLFDRAARNRDTMRETLWKRRGRP